jgi:hypothetical protein
VSELFVLLLLPSLPIAHEGVGNAGYGLLKSLN